MTWLSDLFPEVSRQAREWSPPPRLAPCCGASNLPCDGHIGPDNAITGCWDCGHPLGCHERRGV